MTGQNTRQAEAEALRTFLRLIRPQPLADPYPLCARLRDLAPFLPIRFPGVPAGYLVSTFESCSRLLHDPAFGPPTSAHLDTLRPGWQQNSFTRCLYGSMVFRTGPGHRERRQPTSRYFTPRAVATYRPEFERITATLLDELAGVPAGEPVDLVERLALPFASLCLGRLLDIDDQEAIRLGRLARQAGGAFEQFATAEQHRRIGAAGEELVRGLAAIVTRRCGAGHDLLSGLAASQAGSDEQDLVGAAVLLFGAGFDSPASMVGLGAKLLLSHTEQALLVRDEPSLEAGAVAEILRYEPPVQLVVRAALRPAELASAEIPAGSLVFGLIPAANRDPAQVNEPEVFDVTRERVTSLSFGAGPHYCPGASLTGLQGEVLFGALLRRFPRLQLAGEPVYRSPGSTLRGLDRLPLFLR